MKKISMIKRKRVSEIKKVEINLVKMSRYKKVIFHFTCLKMVVITVEAYKNAEVDIMTVKNKELFWLKTSDVQNG